MDNILVDIYEIVDRHCLNFIFIALLWLFYDCVCIELSRISVGM